MTLSKEDLQNKIKASQEELMVFARNAQAEVNALQGALQTKIRESQKAVDNLDGKIAGYQELLNQLYPETKTDSDNSKQDGKVIEMPASTPSKPDSK